MNDPVFLCVAKRTDGDPTHSAPYADFLDVLSAAKLAFSMQLVGHTDGTDIWYTDEAGAPVLLYMARCARGAAGGAHCTYCRGCRANTEELVADLRAYALPGTYVVKGNDVWATPRALRYAAERRPAPGCPAHVQHC